jgi:hypothetical protein
MPRGEREVSARCQQGQFVAYSQLAQRRINRPASPPSLGPVIEVGVPFELAHQIEQVFLLSAGDEFL